MLTPLDIENREFKRTMSGYNRDDVEDFMAIVLSDYEKLYKENFDLKELLRRMDDELKKLKDNQDSLQNAFLAAQNTADSIVKNAETQASELVMNAQSKANATIAEANIEIDRLNGCYLESRKRLLEYKEQMEKFLKSQIEMIQKMTGTEKGEAEKAAETEGADETKKTEDK